MNKQSEPREPVVVKNIMNPAMCEIFDYYIITFVELELLIDC